MITGGSGIDQISIDRQPRIPDPRRVQKPQSSVRS
jgi:hypothetical protein